MRKSTHALLIITLCLLVASSGYAQQLSESFEKQFFPPAGWKTVNVKGAAAWKAAVENPNQGLKSAFADQEYINNGDFGEGDHWLITPRVYNITAADKLNFYVAGKYLNSPITNPYFETLEVYVSTTTNDISAFTSLLTSINLNNFSPAYQSFSLNLSAYAGQNIYIAFRNHQNQGNGMYLDDVSVTSKLTSDVGSVGINLNNDVVIATGSTIDIVDTLKNLGTSSLAAGIPVKYSINNGTPVVINTSASIPAGGKITVSFTGSNAFVPSTPGDYTLRVYTDNPSEVNRGNDTIIYTLKVRTPISSFPYFQDFSSMNDWTIAGSASFQFINHLTNAQQNYNVTNPAGDKSIAAFAFTYSNFGEVYYLRTPLLNLSTVSRPLLNFYVAAGAFPSRYDELQVVVSTDGGVSFDPLPLYIKSNSTTSKLVTTNPDDGYFYVPSASTQWRHEIVDLSKYAGKSQVMVAFKVTSGGANDVWIDNVEIVSQNNALYTKALVTTNGQVVTGGYASVKFNSFVTSDSVRIEGHNSTPPNWNNFDDNTSSTSQDGSVNKPDFVYDRYFTIAYSGNSITRASYDISLDISGLPGISHPEKFYILKRSDQTDAWTALPTTLSGNILTATGLNTFSDFAIGYNAASVPVTVVSFTGHQLDKIVQLKWATSQEVNISSYELQRWNGTEWIALGSIPSLRIAMQNQYSFDDDTPMPGLNLYRLRIISEIGAITYSEIAKVQFANSANRVYQNVPNPFKSQTVIRLDISQPSKVKVIVYNTTGTQVAVLENGHRQQGTYLLKWNAGNMPAGTYFYKVIINDEVQTRSMLKIE